MNSFAPAHNAALEAEDFELLLLALDRLDRFAQDELAKEGNNTKSAAMINMRSRLLIVRAKLQGMESAQVRPERTKQGKPTPERCEQITVGIGAELGRLHKTNALLIATQFAANHECEFDVSDALAAIIERVEHHIETLDELSLEASP